MESSGQPTLQLSVVTPATWFDLDLDPATRAASIARMVEERTGAGPEEAARRVELRAVLERAAADAATQGAVYAALFSDVIEGRPVSGSLVVSLREGQGGAPPAGMGPRVVVEGLRRVLEGQGTVEVRELPIGPAVRVRKRVHGQIAPGEGPVAEVESVQWFVPLPGGQHLALLSFSTPTVGLAEPFGELFDAIAGTLSWT
jgi:hypothetical protein